MVKYSGRLASRLSVVHHFLGDYFLDWESEEKSEVTPSLGPNNNVVAGAGDMSVEDSPPPTGEEQQKQEDTVNRWQWYLVIHQIHSFFSLMSPFT